MTTKIASAVIDTVIGVTSIAVLVGFLWMIFA